MLSHILFIHSPKRNTALTQIKLLLSPDVRTMSVKLAHAQTFVISTRFRKDGGRFELYVQVKGAVVIDMLFFIPDRVAVVELEFHRVCYCFSFT